MTSVAISRRRIAVDYESLVYLYGGAARWYARGGMDFASLILSQPTLVSEVPMRPAPPISPLIRFHNLWLTS
jgi:hypothetical protein